MNKAIIAVGCIFFSLFGISQVIFFCCHEIPDDYFTIKFSDWMNLFGLVFLSVFLTGFISQKSSMKMKQLEHLIDEVTELIERTESLINICESYMKSDAGVTERSVHFSFRRVSAKRSNIFTIIKTRTPGFNLSQLNSFNQYVDKLRDAVTGDNWVSRKYTISELEILEKAKINLPLLLEGVITKLHEL